MRSNLTMTRGDTQVFEVAFTDSAGDPLDLTGADVRFTVRDLIDKRLGSGIVVDDPLTGLATITIDPDDTGGAYSYTRDARPYDVQVTFADGSVKSPIRGLFIVLPDVTTGD